MRLRNNFNLLVGLAVASVLILATVPASAKKNEAENKELKQKINNIWKGYKPRIGWFNICRDVAVPEVVKAKAGSKEKAKVKTAKKKVCEIRYEGWDFSLVRRHPVLLVSIVSVVGTKDKALQFQITPNTAGLLVSAPVRLGVAKKKGGKVEQDGKFHNLKFFKCTPTLCMAQTKYTSEMGKQFLNGEFLVLQAPLAPLGAINFSIPLKNFKETLKQKPMAMKTYQEKIKVLAQDHQKRFVKARDLVRAAQLKNADKGSKK